MTYAWEKETTPELAQVVVPVPRSLDGEREEARANYPTWTSLITEQKAISRNNTRPGECPESERVYAVLKALWERNRCVLSRRSLGATFSGALGQRRCSGEPQEP